MHELLKMQQKGSSQKEQPHDVLKEAAAAILLLQELSGLPIESGRLLQQLVKVHSIERAHSYCSSLQRCSTKAIAILVSQG
jgi:hypothetical protein